MEGSVSSWRASARLMLRFGAAAVPVIAVDVAKLLIPALTTMHVGREFGAEALAAASLGTLSLNIAGNMIAMSPMNALDSVAPQAHGSGDYAAVGLAAQRAYILSLIFLLPSAPLWIRAETLLGILGQPSRICALAAAFMRLALPGLPAFAGFECARKWLYAQGMVWPPLVAVAFGLTAHLAWLPLSGAMAGFKGAPLAVVATNWICFAALLLIIRYKTPEAAKAWPRGADARQRLWEPRAWRRFVGISVAALCAQSEWLFWEVVCFRVGAFGTLPLAVYSVSYALEPVFFMIPMVRRVQEPNLQPQPALLHPHSIPTQSPHYHHTTPTLPPPPPHALSPSYLHPVATISPPCPRPIPALSAPQFNLPLHPPPPGHVDSARERRWQLARREPRGPRAHPSGRCHRRRPRDHRHLRLRRPRPRYLVSPTHPFLPYVPPHFPHISPLILTVDSFFRTSSRSSLWA